MEEAIDPITIDPNFQRNIQVSNEKKTGYFVYIGDEILPIYVGTIS